MKGKIETKKIRNLGVFVVISLILAVFTAQPCTAENPLAELDTKVSVNDAGDGYIYWQEDSNEAMRLTGYQLGIGTATPGATLDVDPVITTTGDYIGIRSDMEFDPTTGTMTNWYGAYVAAPLITSGSITNKYAFVTESGAGRVGIGDTSPDFKLEVTGSSGDGYFGVSSTDDNADNGDIFKIDSSGNVGIGTAAPQRLLHLSLVGSPELVIENSGANTNQKIWRIRGQSGSVSDLHFEAMNDAFSARTSVMTLTREDKVIIGSYLLPQGNPQGVKLEVQGAIEISDPIPGTHIFYGTNEDNTPTGDGYRFRYDNNFFGTNDDALIIEKTDGNDPNPDGGIAFVNTGSYGTVETGMVIRGDGNVGIGTKSPLFGKLHIDAGPTTTALYIANPMDVNAIGGGAINVGRGLFIDDNEIQATSTLYINYDNNVDLILNKGGGDVGIGIIPSSELHIGGDTPQLTIGDEGTEDTSILFDGNAEDFYIGLIDNQDELVIGTGSVIGSGQVISIDSSLRVGIYDDDGLTYQLEVNGEAEFDGYLRAKDSSGIGLKDAESRKGFHIDGNGNIDIGHSAANIDVYGSLFVGNEGISDRVDSEVNIKENLIVETGVITGDNGESIALGSTNNVIAFTSGGSERMRIHDDDVGIATGSQAPKARLEILSTGTQLRLTNTYDSDYAKFEVTEKGKLKIYTTGEDIYYGDIELRTYHFPNAVYIDDCIDTETGIKPRVGIGTDEPDATLDVNGGLSTNIYYTTSDYTVDNSGGADDYTILVSTTGGVRKITLPDASTCKGRIIVIKRIAGSDNVEIYPAEGDYIDGVGPLNPQTLGHNGYAHTYQAYDNNNWYIIADKD